MTEFRDRGLSCYLEGDLDGAIRYLKESSRLFVESGDLGEQGRSLSDLGAILALRGEWDEARTCLNRSLELLTSAGDKSGQAHVLGNLGALHSRCGDPSLAEENLLRAASLFGELGEDRLGSDTWKAIGKLRLRQGKWLGAMIAYQQGLDCLRHPSLATRFLRWLYRLPSLLLSR